MIKMIAIDLDGTLLTDQKQISVANKAALAAAKAQGVKIVLCTGRPLTAIEGYLEELQLTEPGDYSITFNGGLVQKNDTGEIMEKAALSLAEVLEIAQLASDLSLPLDVLVDGLVKQLPTASSHPSIYGELNRLLTFVPATLAELNELETYNKVVVAIEADYLDQQAALIPTEFRDKYEVIKTRANLLEFMPKGITKAYGIELLAGDLGITAAEVMAIGDEENDIPMIEYAGIGVAMANAVPAAKAVADVVTLSNEADGVAQVVQEYVLR